MKYYLHSEETLFRTRDAFEIDHVPEEFNYREAQMKDLAFAIRPGVDGGRPLNAILRGIPGTGKSTAVKRIFHEIEETTKKIVPVYINCQAERSVYSVLSKIYARLAGHLPPPKGIPVPQIIHAIGEQLGAKKVVLLVCFDDANYLLPGNRLNSLLYILLRLHDEHNGARAGVLLPMSDMDVDLSKILDTCVLSVLQPTEIYFPPYTGPEIRDILGQRVKAGLYPGVISPGVFDILIDHTMQSGDTRVGLDLIKRSVMSAEQAGRHTVIENDVIASSGEADLVHMYSSIKALGTDERKLLGHIAGLTRDAEAPLTTGKVFEASNEYLHISYTGLFSKLRKFSDMRLIDLPYVNSWGRSREIALRYDAEKVVEACGGW